MGADERCRYRLRRGRRARNVISATIPFVSLLPGTECKRPYLWAPVVGEYISMLFNTVKIHGVDSLGGLPTKSAMSKAFVDRR